MPNAPAVSYWILKDQNRPAVEADPDDVEFNWPKDKLAFPDGSTEVAPGVRVKLLSYGDHWNNGGPEPGALIAVQDATGTRP